MSLRLTARPLSISAAFRELERPGLGGVVLFAGRVRPDRSGSTRVVALDYEVHEGPARQVLAEIDRSAKRRFGVTRTVLWHRVGRVAAGEVSVIVGASAAHRSSAFLGARYLIDRLKETVPIWKSDRAPFARRPRRTRRPRAGRTSD
ncbi:MAG: molybdenum cofactor biosynthesis protein MoaE [Thermoplasmata archaeon]